MLLGLGSAAFPDPGEALRGVTTTRHIYGSNGSGRTAGYQQKCRR
jgi:hypothetical protein